MALADRQSVRQAATTEQSATVTVRATDSTGTAAHRVHPQPNIDATVTITITNVDETPTFSTGAKTVTVPENSYRSLRCLG